ncbi:MAG TPA: KH domain-containing protein [Chloroflexota bacterium]|jgi:hypothetical protein|nr:KH domain-containing protein [Chloroflexota bacterium]
MRRAPLRTQPLPGADAFCLTVARHVVGDPGSVKVASVEGQELIVIELSAPAEDVGRLVGRDGRTIGAIRTLAEALAQRMGKRIIVDVQPAQRRV